MSPYNKYMNAIMLALFMFNPSSPLDFKMDTIEGKPKELKEYRGKAVMMVNVASKCGLTPQYAELEALYRKYKEKGFVILAFPANNFRDQEPGTNEEIARFCKENYDVSFPLFAKISVKGDDIHPLYAWLTSQKTNPKFAGEITWNFEKFLINRKGDVIARFAPRVKPSDEAVVKAIEDVLK